MIELPCSCGKADCPNKIRVYCGEEKYIMVDHSAGGTDQMIHTSTSRLRRFAYAILRAFPDDRPRVAQKR